MVLVVDDHPIDRLVLMRQVAMLGYANESAEDGRQALELWKSGRFALVITDCNMPVMDAYRLARAIRAAEQESGPPAHPGHRMHGERPARRGGKLLRGGHGRLRREARGDGDAAREDGPLAPTAGQTIASRRHRFGASHQGAGRTIGAAALAEVCERIEAAAHAGDWAAGIASLEAFRGEVARLNAYLSTASAR